MIVKSLSRNNQETENGLSLQEILKKLAEDLKESVSEQLVGTSAPELLFHEAAKATINAADAANGVMSSNMAGGRVYNNKYIEAKLADFATLRQLKKDSIRSAWAGYDDYDGSNLGIRRLRERKKLYEEQAKSGQRMKAETEERIARAQAPKDSEGNPIELTTESVDTAQSQSPAAAVGSVELGPVVSAPSVQVQTAAPSEEAAKPAVTTSISLIV